MAAETHTSTATATATNDEPVGNKVKEETMVMEQDIISLTKETETDDSNPRTDSAPRVTKDEQIEPPYADTKETVEPEKDSPVVVEPGADSTNKVKPEKQQNVECLAKEVEQSPSMESVKKGQDEHHKITDASESADESKVEPEKDSFVVVETGADTTNKVQPEEQQDVESLAKEVEQSPSMESVEKGQDGHHKITDASETADESKVEQVEPKEVHPVEVVENDIKEAVEVTEQKQEEQPIVDAVAEDVQEQPAIESAEKEQEEHLKMADLSESPDEVIEKQVETVEEQPVKEESAEAAEKVESETREAAVHGFEAKVEAKPEVSEQVETVSAKAKEPTSEVEVNPNEQFETTGQADGIKGSEVESSTELEGETVKVEEKLAEKVEDSVTTSLKDEKASEPETSIGTESSDQAVPSNQEAVPELKRETEEASLPSDVIENVSAKDETTDVVEGLPKEAVVETKVEKENLIEEKDVVTEEPKHTAINTDSATAEEEKFEGEEKISRDVEPPADNKSAETVKEIDSESKQKENPEEKQDELVKEKVEKTAETEPDVKTTEISAKDGGDQKQQPEIVSKEVQVKPTTKHSNNILSKVKQSFVKAKKVIIGKSLNSKTLTTEAKGETVK